MTKLYLPLLAAIVLCLSSALPAQAEAFGNQLGDAITALVSYAVVYLGLAITLLVLAVWRNWRGFKLAALAGGAVLVIYPLLDMGLYAWQTARIKSAEIRHQAPDLQTKTVLFISPETRCNSTPCEGVMALQEHAPLWTIAAQELENLDLSQPIDLTTVPMSQWVDDAEGYKSYELIPAPPGDRPAFDYVVYARSPFYRARAGQLEAALTQMPSATALGDKVYVLDLAAPLGSDQLYLPELAPDLLSFYNARIARKVPLFVENTIHSATHSFQWRKQRAEWYCGTGDERTDAQFTCSMALRR